MSKKEKLEEELLKEQILLVRQQRLELELAAHNKAVRKRGTKRNLWG